MVSDDEIPVQRIEAGRRSLRTSFRELWTGRELIAFLAQRDLKVRYRQTLLGAAWAVIQPAVTMAVFTLFLSGLVPTPGIPYPLFALSGLVPWLFFASAVGAASSSLLANVSMLSKVYFPRLAMPLAAVVAVLLDLLVALAMLLGVMFAYGRVPGVRMLALPGFTLLAVAAAAGVGFLFSALSVEYRDFRFIVPFMVQTLLFLTPVAYPVSLVDEPWQSVLAVNPMLGVVEGYRWSLFGEGNDLTMSVAISGASAFALLVVGVAYFCRREPVFADVA